MYTIPYLPSFALCIFLYDDYFASPAYFERYVGSLACAHADKYAWCVEHGHTTFWASKAHFLGFPIISFFIVLRYLYGTRSIKGYLINSKKFATFIKMNIAPYCLRILERILPRI